MIILSLLFSILLSPVVAGGASPAVAGAQTAVATPLEIEGTTVDGLAIEPVTVEARYATAGSTLYSVDEAGAWQADGASPERNVLVVDTRNPDVVWAGTGLDCYRGGSESQSMLLSTDGGASWADTGAQDFVPLASWVDSQVVIAHDCSGLQVSRDGGATWSLPEGLPLGSQVTAFTVASSPESAAGLTLLVGVTGEGGTSQLYRVNLSDPGAMSVDGPLQTYYGLGAVAVEADGAIVLGAPQGVLRSEDRGETWTVLRDGLESTTLEQDPIEFFPTDLEPGSFGLRSILTANQAAFVSGVDGIYQLAEDGEQWQKIAELDVEVSSMAVEPVSGALLVESTDGDVLRVELA